MLPLLAGCVIWFAILFVRPDWGPEGGRGDWFFGLVGELTAGGLGWGWAGLAGLMGWELIRLLRRVADEDAMVAREDGLHLHHSLKRRIVPWREVVAIRFERVPVTWGYRNEVTLEVREGRAIRARAVDDENGAARAFVDQMQDRLTAP